MDNPFLERFYKDRRAAAFPAQLHFLFQRARQPSETAPARPVRAGADRRLHARQGPAVARIVLDDEEFKLYDEVYTRLAMDAPVPDLVVFLQAPVDILLERIDKRGIAYEKYIDAAYLERLGEAYTRYFHQYTASPLLIVNTAEIEPANNSRDFDDLFEPSARREADVTTSIPCGPDPLARERHCTCSRTTGSASSRREARARHFAWTRCVAERDGDVAQPACVTETPQPPRRLGPLQESASDQPNRSTRSAASSSWFTRAPRTRRGGPCRPVRLVGSRLPGADRGCSAASRLRTLAAQHRRRARLRRSGRRPRLAPREDAGMCRYTNTCSGRSRARGSGPPVVTAASRLADGLEQVIEIQVNCWQGRSRRC